MKMRIETSERVTTEEVRRVLRYAGAVIEPNVAEARVRVREYTDKSANALVRCRVQLRQCDGELTIVDEVQPTLELAVTRAFGRGIRTVRRRQRLRNGVG